MSTMQRPTRQRLVYHSEFENSSITGTHDDISAEVDRKADIVSYLSVASALQIDFIPYTWHPNLGGIGRGQTGSIQQSIANLQTSFAFKTFDGLSPGDAFEEAIAEIQVLGDPSIRDHPNIVNLEGVCWNVLPGEDVLPVLVFEKTNLGSLSSFMQAKEGNVSIETRLQLSIDIIRAISILHSRDIFHGDIKPENILLFQSVEERIAAKIIDFSFAVTKVNEGTFQPKPGTPRWRDPGWHYRSQWSFSRAKGADMYSLGLLLVWLLSHGFPSASALKTQLQDEKNPKQMLSFTFTLLKELGISDEVKHTLMLLFMVCFNPDPDMRTLALTIQSLHVEDPYYEDMQSLYVSGASFDNYQNTSSLEALATCLENRILQGGPAQHVPAKSGLPSLPNSNVPISTNDKYQLDISSSSRSSQMTISDILQLFDIATPLYSAHVRVRACVSRALRSRVESAVHPSATDLGNLYICLQLGFGVDASETEKVKSLSCLGSETAAAYASGLKKYKAPYKYLRYDESNFRTALKLGHLDSLDLAQTYLSSGDADHIEEACRIELLNVQRILGEMQHIVCTLTATLASLCYLRDKLLSAAELQKSLLDIYLQKYSAESRHTQSAKANLAVTYRDDGHYDEAEALFTEVLNIRRRSLGEEHMDTLLVQSDLASMFLTRGSWAQAEQSLREVVRKSVVVLGSDHPHSIILRGNLSSALQNNGKINEANTELTIALEASGRVHGEKHIETVTCINNLMSMYNDSKVVDERTNDHLVRTENAARVAADMYDHSHSFTLRVRSNIAQAYIDRNRYEEAGVILREIIRESERGKGESHIDTLTMEGTLFHVLYHQSNWEEAIKLSLCILGRMDERRNPGYPIVLGNLAAVYSKFKDVSKAIEAASRAYTMQSAQCGKDHRLTLLALENLRRYQGAAAEEAARQVG